MKFIIGFLSVGFLLAQTDYVTDIKNKPFSDSRQFKFTRTNGVNASGNLSVAGANSVTLTPVPLGVNFSDTAHQIYISGGVGTAEVVTITGGSATSGAASGSLSFTTANTHTGSWTITSATNGKAEAQFYAAGSTATVFVPTTNSGDPATITTTNEITLLDLSKRTAGNTNNRFSIVRNGATPEYEQQVVLPPPYTQVVNSAFTAGTNFPAGSTNWQENAILGTCRNRSGTWNPAGPPPQAACVALMGVAIAEAAKSPVWGMNLVVGGTPSFDSPLVGLEIDMGVYSTDAAPYRKNGIQLSIGGTAAGGDAIVVNSFATGAGTAQWNFGMLLEGSALYTNGVGIRMQAQTNTPFAGLDIQGTNWTGGAIRLANNSSIHLVSTTGNDGLIYNDLSNNIQILAGNGGSVKILGSSGNGFSVDTNGALVLRSVTFAQLNSVLTADNMMVYCSDCTIANPCAGSGSGSIAKRLNSVKVCN